MTIYEELIERVSNGDPFQVDFEKRNMRVGKKYIILRGEYDVDRMQWPLIEMNDVLDIIEDLYARYKYSLPSERSDSKRKSYFKALSVSELTDEQMATGEMREVAKARLEGFILCMILTGQFVWNETTMGKWFWQSVNNPDLVILRSWIENKK